MSTAKAVTPTGDTGLDDPSAATDAQWPTPDNQPCGHPQAHGVCWFSQIADQCAHDCKWLIDRDIDTGR